MGTSGLVIEPLPTPILFRSQEPLNDAVRQVRSPTGFEEMHGGSDNLELPERRPIVSGGIHWFEDEVPGEAVGVGTLVGGFGQTAEPAHIGSNKGLVAQRKGGSQVIDRHR